MKLDVSIRHMTPWEPTPLRLPHRPIPRPTLEALTPPAPDFPYFAYSDEIRFESNPVAEVLSQDGLLIDANAWWLADASMLAYGDAVFIEKSVEGSPLPSLGWSATPPPEDGDDLRMLVLNGPDSLVLAFRGTRIPVPDLAPSAAAGLVDWILGNEDLKIDGRFLPAAHQAGGRVHSGFLHAFQAMSDHIDEIVARKQPHQSLWLTGHSLGGALAVLAASHLRDVTPLAGLYTYGAPRVGDAEFFATLPTCPYRRFVHGEDLIPTIPPAWPLGYAEAGEQIAVPGVTPRFFWQEWTDGCQTLATAIQLSIERKRIALGEVPVFVRGLSDHAPVFYASLLWNSLVDGLQSH